MSRFLADNSCCKLDYLVLAKSHSFWITLYAEEARTTLCRVSLLCRHIFGTMDKTNVDASANEVNHSMFNYPN